MLQLLQKIDFMDWIAEASKCPVLQGVSPDELLSLFERIQFQVRRYRKGELLAFQGDEVNRLMILLEGSTRGEMTDSSGQVIKIEDVSAPRPLAGAFLFGQESRFPVDVIANEPLKVLVIYKDEFLKLLTMDQRILVNYLNLVGSKAQFLTTRIKFLSFKTIKGKLAHYITGLNREGRNRVAIPVSQQDLADLFGVARPSVARGLSELEKEGVLEVKNRQVRILSRTRLKRYLEE